MFAHVTVKVVFCYSKLRESYRKSNQLCLSNHGASSGTCSSLKKVWKLFRAGCLFRQTIADGMNSEFITESSLVEMPLFHVI